MKLVYKYPLLPSIASHINIGGMNEDRIIEKAFPKQKRSISQHTKPVEISFLHMIKNDNSRERIVKVSPQK
jgi:hypothetical protein